MKKLTPLLQGLLLVVGLFSSAPVFGEGELPNPGEPFPTYFARLTRGGGFPGIYLKAGEQFQGHFFKTIQKGFWVGPLNKERNRLTNIGVDLWFNWYRTSLPIETLKGISGNLDFYESLEKKILKDCSVEIAGLEWRQANLCVRRSLSMALVFELRDRKNLRLLDHIETKYQLNRNSLFENVEIFFEDGEGFKKKVCEMGYCGEIYFRGITGPNPKNSQKRWIVLNDTLMRTMTPFDRPILQMLEYSGILTHELNHVAQDLAGAARGWDIQIRKAEDAMVIEGMAEFNNQMEWYEFGKNLPPENPISLFAAEQGVEIVYREGNSTSGRLFPYTIGLPLVAAYYQFRDQKIDQVNLDLLETLSGEGRTFEFLVK